MNRPKRQSHATRYKGSSKPAMDLEEEKSSDTRYEMISENEPNLNIKKTYADHYQ